MDDKDIFKNLFDNNFYNHMNHIDNNDMFNKSSLYESDGIKALRKNYDVGPRQQIKKRKYNIIIELFKIALLIIIGLSLIFPLLWIFNIGTWLMGVPNGEFILISIFDYIFNTNINGIVDTYISMGFSICCGVFLSCTLFPLFFFAKYGLLKSIFIFLLGCFVILLIDPNLKQYFHNFPFYHYIEYLHSTYHLNRIGASDIFSLTWSKDVTNSEYMVFDISLFITTIFFSISGYYIDYTNFSDEKSN